VDAICPWNCVTLEYEGTVLLWNIINHSFNNRVSHPEDLNPQYIKILPHGIRSGLWEVWKEAGGHLKGFIVLFFGGSGGWEGTSHQAVQSPICQGRDREENKFRCKLLNISVSITYFIPFPSLIFWLVNDHEHQRWHKYNGHEQRTQKPPCDLPV